MSFLSILAEMCIRDSLCVPDKTFFIELNHTIGTGRIVEPIGKKIPVSFHTSEFRTSKLCFPRNGLIVFHHRTRALRPWPKRIGGNSNNKQQEHRQAYTK